MATIALATSSIGTFSWAEASSPVVVRLPGCEVNGGEATVPAGSEVTIGIAWISVPRGGVQQFLDAIESTVRIDSTAIPDANSLFGPITRNLVPAGGSAAPLRSYWGTQWLYQLGTLNEGDQVVVTTSWILTERIVDVITTERPAAIFVGPGEIFGGICTIRAVSED